MKFLVDAHLPRRLVYRLKDAGHEGTHTLDLPHANRTPDNEIIDIAVREQHVVVTKDADFVNSFWLARRPPKLLLVSTGNITNMELEVLFVPQIQVLVELFTVHNFIEFTRTRLIIHD